MVKAKSKKFVQPKPKPGRKPARKRRQYTLDFKAKVIAWHNVDKMKPCDIKKKLYEELGYEMKSSTLSTW